MGVFVGARAIMNTTYLSVREVARYFGVTPSTVYRLAQQGLLPGLKVGGQWRFSEQMLESWAADQVTVERLRAEDQKTRSLNQPGQT